MKRIFPIILIAILLLSTIEARADEPSEQVVEFGSELWNQLRDKWITMNTFGEEAFEVIQQKFDDIAQTVGLEFQENFSNTAAGIVQYYLLRGLGLQGLTDYLNSLNRNDDPYPATQFLPLNQVRWTYQGYTWYYTVDGNYDVYATFIRSGNYGGFYFYSYQSLNNANIVLHMRGDGTATNIGIPLNTNQYQNENGTYYYTYHGGGFISWNQFPQFFQTGYEGAVAFYGYIPIKSFQTTNINSNTAIYPTNLGDNYQQIYENNYTRYINGSPINAVFQLAHDTYNTNNIDNSYPTVPLPSMSYPQVDSSIDAAINGISELPDIEATNYDFITASFNILPGSLKGCFMLSMTLLGISFLLGLGQKGITK